MDVFFTRIKDFDEEYLLDIVKFGHKTINHKNKLFEHCFSYMILSCILKKYYKISEFELIFDNKKPILKNKEINFSISHSGGYLALCFSEFPCGIDLEKIKQRDFLAISKRLHFKAQELAAFYNEWTLFEATYKLAEGVRSCKNYTINDFSLTVVSSNQNEEFNLYSDDLVLNSILEV